MACQILMLIQSNFGMIELQHKRPLEALHTGVDLAAVRILHQTPYDEVATTAGDLYIQEELLNVTIRATEVC